MPTREYLKREGKLTTEQRVLANLSTVTYIATDTLAKRVHKSEPSVFGVLQRLLAEGRIEKKKEGKSYWRLIKKQEEQKC